MILYGIDNIRDLFGHKVRPTGCPRLRPAPASWPSIRACGRTRLLMVPCTKPLLAFPRGRAGARYQIPCATTGRASR